MQIITSHPQEKYPNVRLVGLMGMATFTSDLSQIRKEFISLKRMYDESAKHVECFTSLSMGMSNDYSLAIEEGSTMIRVGSKIFGERNY